MKINRITNNVDLGAKAGRVGVLLAFAFLVLSGLSGAASADWSSDALGEGSGLDRGASMASGTPAANAVQSAASSTVGMTSLGEAALRASIEEAMSAQIASSFDYNASAGGSFGSGGIGVSAVAAGGGDDLDP